MTIIGKEELFDEQGNIPVWGRVSASGKPYYTFALTEEDKRRVPEKAVRLNRPIGVSIYLFVLFI